MRKFLLASAAAAALAGSAFAYSAFAAQGDAPDGADMRPSMEERGFLFEARLAGMKAALKLTPEQESAWAPFEAAVRDAAKVRAEAMHEMRERMRSGERPTPIARMIAISDGLAKASTELKKVADAAKPLFDSLDETQKRHFGPLLASLRERGPHNGMRALWEHRDGGDAQ